MSFDSSCGFLFNHLHYNGGCQYVKSTKQILIAVCVVEFSVLLNLVVNIQISLLYRCWSYN